MSGTVAGKLVIQCTSVYDKVSDLPLAAAVSSVTSNIAVVTVHIEKTVQMVN
jgi:hypothetical protein